MLVSTARLATPNGSRYLQQLCKHFAHKVPVSFDEAEGRCELSNSAVVMAADAAGLGFTITAPAAKDLITARYVVDSHLVTFAFRENFTGLDWRLDAG